MYWGVVEGNTMMKDHKKTVLQDGLFINHSCFLNPFLIAMTSPTRINTMLAPAKIHLIMDNKERIHASAVGCERYAESKITMMMFSRRSKNHAPSGRMLKFRMGLVFVNPRWKSQEMSNPKKNRYTMG
jgi:hypothetical protein